MRTRATMVLFGLTMMLVLCLSLGTRAQPETEPLPGIGVVSVMEVIQNCKTQADNIKQLTEERSQYLRELEKEKNESEAEQQMLKQLLPGTEDYMTQVKVVIDKQAQAQALEEYYTQVMTAKDMKLRSQLYQDILSAVEKVARDKGLNMVFERTEPEFPVPVERFAVTVSTHKLIYCPGAMDITDDVIAVVDKSLESQ